MANRETVGQHYVPRTYLKNFAEQIGSGHMINVLKKDAFSVDKIIKVSVANICKENNVYTLPGDTEEERLYIENFYCRQFESNYNTLYAILTNPNKKVLTPEERESVIGTVVTMFYRTTKPINDFITDYNTSIERAYAESKAKNLTSFTVWGLDFEIEGKSVLEVQMDYKMKIRQSMVVSLLNTAIDLIRERTAKDGILITKIVDDELDFVTSDNPVPYFNLENKAANSNNTSNVLTLPLDNKHMLSLLPIADESSKLTIARRESKGTMALMDALIANHQQFENSERFILGSRQSLERHIKLKEQGDQVVTKEQIEQSSAKLDELKQQLKNLDLL